MKKFLTAFLLASTVALQACWFTVANFNNNYISGVNNFVEHYTPANSLSSAVYHNGGSVSLPLTVYVKLSPRTPDQQGESVVKQIQVAILQYKVKHNNTWSNWKTVKSFSNNITVFESIKLFIFSLASSKFLTIYIFCNQAYTSVLQLFQIQE